MKSNNIRIIFNSDKLIKYSYITNSYIHRELVGHSMVRTSLDNSENKIIDVNIKTFDPNNLLVPYVNNIIISVLADIKNKDRSVKINKLLSKLDLFSEN